MTTYTFLLSTILTICIATSAQAEQRHSVRFNTTRGDIVIQLYNETPIHRDNFLKLTYKGYFDGLLFHRVIRDFMIQSGDPQSRNATPHTVLGEGGPDYTLPSEIATPTIFHKRGAVAAARKSDRENPERRSSGSQFYIVWGEVYSPQKLKRVARYVEQSTEGTTRLSPAMRRIYETIGGTPHLDGQYTVFGEVTQGLDIVEAIQQVETDDNDRPLQDVRILQAVVLPEGQ